MATLLLALACAYIAHAPAHARDPSEVPPDPPAHDGGPQANLEPSQDLAAPSTPEDRRKSLDSLYDGLAKASDDAAATAIRANIRQLWLDTGSPTLDLLLARDAQAAAAHDTALRRQLLEAAGKLGPDTVEIWNRRAGLDYGEQRLEAAMADLARVLTIDPRHFEAMEALATILKDTGRDALALKAYRRLKTVNPTAPNLQSQIDDLARKVDGQKI